MIFIIDIIITIKVIFQFKLCEQVSLSVISVVNLQSRYSIHTCCLVPN